MKPLLSLGLDPSIKATGVVLLRSNGTPYPDLVIEREIKFDQATEGIQRVRSIVTHIMTLIHEQNPDEIIVEGYSLNTKNASSIIPLVELGGVLRFLMELDGLKWRDPKAGKLKKFITGSGSTPKDQIMMHVLKRWGHTSKTNNTADAYGLACIGLAAANRLPGITVDMRKIAGELPLRSS